MEKMKCIGDAELEILKKVNLKASAMCYKKKPGENFRKSRERQEKSVVSQFVDSYRNGTIVEYLSNLTSRDIEMLRFLIPIYNEECPGDLFEVAEAEKYIEFLNIVDYSRIALDTKPSYISIVNAASRTGYKTAARLRKVNGIDVGPEQISEYLADVNDLRSKFSVAVKSCNSFCVKEVADCATLEEKTLMMIDYAANYSDSPDTYKYVLNAVTLYMFFPEMINTSILGVPVIPLIKKQALPMYDVLTDTNRIFEKEIPLTDVEDAKVMEQLTSMFSDNINDVDVVKVMEKIIPKDSQGTPTTP